MSGHRRKAALLVATALLVGYVPFVTLERTAYVLGAALLIGTSWRLSVAAFRATEKRWPVRLGRRGRRAA